MFSTIIVGIDGSAAGEDAFAFARSLAAEDTDIVLVAAMAFDVTMPTELRIGQRTSVSDDDKLARDTQRLLHDLAGDDEHAEIVIRPNVPAAQALHEEARRTGADLIVVGRTHQRPPARLLFGDMSRATLHGAPCPVAVVPPDFRSTGKYVRVLAVACNDGDETRAAASYAAAVAESIDARLHLANVVGLPSSMGPAYAYAFDWSEIDSGQRGAGNELLASLAADLPVGTTTEMLDGPIGAALEDLSRRVDAIVAGSRGWGTAKSVILGSTTDRLVHHAACPVIVVPRPRDTGGAGDQTDAAAVATPTATS